MAKTDFWLTRSGLLLIASWRRSGVSVSKIAEKIGISAKGLERLSKKNKMLSEALMYDREQTDAMVEEALLKKALGFFVSEEKRVLKANGQEEVTTVSKEVPPDVSAASVWLKNRCPDRWRDKPSESDKELMKHLEEIMGGIDAEADR
ncbi:MAG: helix-turn-helix domain-containing protein [Clostridia bacterium]|nr:helix-turn-helix domain-containing protein [Clostridia bacterium]